MTRSIDALRTRSGTLNGPATTAPSVSSMAITTPPDSNGLTIQLKPRSATGRSASASGCFARSRARSIPSSTATRSASVQASGSRGTGAIMSVVAWLSPRSQISTGISTLQMFSQVTGTLVVPDLLEAGIPGMKMLSQERRGFVADALPPGARAGVPHVIAADALPFCQPIVGRIRVSLLEHEQVPKGHAAVAETPDLVL